MQTLLTSCDRNLQQKQKVLKKFGKDILDRQSSSRWGAIHLLLELLKCIHTTSENNSEAQL